MIHVQAEKKGLGVTHFYWALYFMRTYATEMELARNLNTKPKTFSRKVKEVIKVLSSKMHLVVS